MNQFEMVVVIVLIVMVSSVLRAWFKYRSERPADAASPTDEAETRRLHLEVARLRDRLAVLERITVEKENSLASEIEQLRDR